MSPISNITFNVALGRVVQLALNVDGNSPAGCTLTVVAIKTAGLESDATLKDYDTLADILAASNDEATNSGYSRKQLTGADITVTVDDSTDTTKVILVDQSWTAVGIVAPPNGAWSKLIIGYNPTGSSADSAIIPLEAVDFVVIPDGNDILIDFSATNGVFQAS